MIEIKNESDYEKAAQRAESLEGAKAGTPEKKELDELTKAMKEYEDNFVRMLKDNG